MKTAVVVLCTGDYWKGAKVLFHTLKKHGNLTAKVDRFALGMERCSFAEPLPIPDHYTSWVSVSENFPKVADKFYALDGALDHDRIIMLDADMLCVGDCSYLWSDAVGQLPFYACRDTASILYYPKQIHQAGLDVNRLFNAGAMVFQRGSTTTLLDGIQKNLLQSYDGGDQGYLNHYFQTQGAEIGFLPPEYNCCLDTNMPQVPDHGKRLVHFTAHNAKPWMDLPPPVEWHEPYLQLWQTAWEECS